MAKIFSSGNAGGAPRYMRAVSNTGFRPWRSARDDGRPIGLRRVDEDHLAGALVDQGAKQQIGAGLVLGEKWADLVAIPAGAQHAVAGDIAVA